MFYVLLYLGWGVLIPLGLNSSSSYKIRQTSLREEVYDVRWTYSLFFAFTITVMIKGIAFDTGTDFMYYHDHYKSVFYGYKYSWGDHTEFGYRFLLSVLTKLTSSSIAFFSLAAFIVTYSTLKLSVFFGRGAFYTFLVWPIFMFTLSLNLYRQYFAIAFVYFVVYFLLCGKKRWSFIFSFLAVSFHVSSIVVIVAIWFIYTIKSFKINKFVIIGLILITTFSSHVVNDWLFSAIDVFQIVFGIANDHAYSSENIFKSMYDSSIVKYIIMLTYVIWIWFGDKLIKGNWNFRFIYYLSVISFIVYPIFQQEILSRINLYFAAFIPFFLGYLIYFYRNTKGHQKYIISAGLFLLGVRYIYYLFLQGQAHPFQLNL
jgi:hypothetical protein